MADLEKLEARVKTLETQNAALAETLLSLQGTPVVDANVELVQRIEALENRPVAQESISVKKKEAKGIPTETFSVGKTKMKLVVGAIRHEGKRVTAADIIEMDAAKRKEILDLYPNIAEQA